MNRFLLVFAFFFLLSACGRYPANVNKALEISGAHRAELVQVLEHYSRNPADSLKLRAAEFLIANMPGHYSIAGDEMKRFVAQVDSMYPNLPYSEYPAVYLQPVYNKKLKNKPCREYDIETISADYLIKNIEFKFALLDIVPWGAEIPFEVFCETILPYRYDVEPLRDIPQDSLDNYLGELREAIAEVNNIKMNTLTLHLALSKLVFRDKQNIFREMPTPVYFKQFDCVLTAIATQCRNVWLCIPSTIDFTPHWASKNNGHHWVCLSGLDNRKYTISEMCSEIMSKVYRKTFSQNVFPEDSVLSTRFLKDVTKYYLNSECITLDVDYKGEVNTVYLCTFTGNEWKPVAWSKIRNKKVTFGNMGWNVLYLAVVYEYGVQKCVGDPFYINMSGKVNTIKYDVNNTHKIHLTRKYPLYENSIQHYANVDGMSIEASNSPDFKTSEQIDTRRNFVIKSHHEFMNINRKSYRYWRLKNTTKGFYLAEFRFFNENRERMIGKPIFEKKNIIKYVSLAFDDNILTNTIIYNWVGIDFGKRITPARMEIMLRTDANDIYPGDVYELCYWDDSEWVRIEIREALDYFMDYENVPVGALYLLRNLTEGKEHRPFTVENGYVRFW